MSLTSSCSFPVLVVPLLASSLISQVAAAPITSRRGSGTQQGSGNAQPVTRYRHFHGGQHHRAHKHRRFRKRQDSDPGPNNLKKSDKTQGYIDIVLLREDDDDAKMASLHVDCTAEPCAFDLTSRKPTPVFLVNAPDDGYKLSATADGTTYKPVLLEVPTEKLKGKAKAEAKNGPQCVTYRTGSVQPESSIMTIEPCIGPQSASGDVSTKAADSVKSQIFAYQESTRTIRPFWLAGIQGQPQPAEKEKKPAPPVDLDDRAVSPQRAAFKFQPIASKQELAARQDAGASEPATTTVISTTIVTLTEAAAPTSTPGTPVQQAADPSTTPAAPESPSPAGTNPGEPAQAIPNAQPSPETPSEPAAAPTQAAVPPDSVEPGSSEPGTGSPSDDVSPPPEQPVNEPDPAEVTPPPPAEEAVPQPSDAASTPPPEAAAPSNSTAEASPPGSVAPPTVPSSSSITVPMNATEVAEDLTSQATIQEELDQEVDEPIATLGAETEAAPVTSGGDTKVQEDNSRVEFPEAVTSANVGEEGAGDQERPGGAEPLADDGDVLVPLDTEPYVWKFEEIGKKQ